MRKLLTLSVAFMASSALFLSCQKDKSTSASPVSEDVLTQIKAMGFSTDNVTAQDGGYIVEGDIFLSPSDFGRMSTKNYLIIEKMNNIVPPILLPELREQLKWHLIPD